MYSLLPFLVVAAIGGGVRVDSGGGFQLDAPRGRLDTVRWLHSDRVLLQWDQTYEHGNSCHVSSFAIDDEERQPRRDHGLFEEASRLALCCVARSDLRVRSSGGLAITSCSGRDGVWIWSQSLTPDGAPTSLPAPVFPVPGVAQKSAALVDAARGESWLVWVESLLDDRDRGIVRGARLDPDGGVTAGPYDLTEDRAASALSGWDHLAPSAAALPDGGLAVAWVSAAGRHLRGLRLRLTDRDGRPTTPEIEATPQGHERAKWPRLHVSETGALNLVWQRSPSRDEESGPPRLFFRRFSPTGEPLGSALPLADDHPDRAQLLPRIEAEGEHRLLVWYETPRGDVTADEGWLALRRWHPDHGPVGLTTRVPAALAGVWRFLEVVPDPSRATGDFTLFWHPNGPKGFAEPAAVGWRRIKVPATR